MKSAAFVLACALSSVALAVPPAPVVTVHASGIKKLTFEWAPVAGASRYDLWFKANDNAPWTRYLRAPAPRSSFTTGVAVHLLHWPQARFQLKACDASGCSTSNTVRVNSEKTVAMGFFKPESPTDTFYFGGNVALSADGATMAAVSGEPINDNNPNSAVVYVYRRTTSSWRREARLVPSIAPGAASQPFLGDQVALSADGNLLVLGLWTENRSGPNPAEGTGAVYLFRRTGSTWRFAQKLVSQDGAFDYFGYVVKVDDAGQTLAISHMRAAEEYVSGTLEVFRDNPDDGTDRFVHITQVPVPRQGDTTDSCEAVALSGDGNTLLRACYLPSAFNPYVQALETTGFTETGRFLIDDQTGIDVSYDGTQAVVNEFGGALAFRLTSTGWVSDGFLSTFGGVGSHSKRHVAISRDGKFAAVGSTSDVAAGLGPIFEPYQTADDPSGGVIIHERKNSGWVIRRLVKPGSTNNQYAGWSVALGDNGKALAVGAIFDSSAATGIDGEREDSSAPNRGAVWLY